MFAYVNSRRRKSIPNHPPNIKRVSNHLLKFVIKKGKKIMRAIKALEVLGTLRFFSQLIKVRFFIAATILVSAFYATQSLGGAASPAQQGSRIRGTVAAVTADRRQPLLGAVVTLGGAVLQGKKLQAVSDEDGAYDFTGLIAGDYVLSVEVPGFEKYEQRMMVAIEAAVVANILLQPTALNESVTVTADENQLDKTSSSVAGQISTTTLRNAPLVNERFQDALPLLPGVVRGPDGLLNIKGARASQSGVLVSSLNVTDPVTGNAAIELPLEAVETIQVYSNPYSAEYGKFTGALTSIETRSGSNQWRYLVTNVLVRPRVREGHIVGVQSATPRIAVGGPIVKDKLFFFQGLEYRFVRTEVPSSRLPLLGRDNKLESFDSFTRVDYNVNATNRLTASFSLFPQKRDFFNLNSFNPLETTANFHQRGWFFALNEQAVFGDGGLLQSGFSVKQFDADIFGNSGEPYVIAPERRFGGWFDRQHRESRRYEWLETYNLPERRWRGRHALKLGFNVSRTSFDGRDTSAPVRIARADNTTSRLVGFSGSGELQRNNIEFAAFAQDKWNVNERVTLDLGLRLDRDQLGAGNNFAPRLGFAVLPTRSARTVIRGGVGLFYDKIPLSVGVFEQYQNFVITDYATDGVTAVGAPRLLRNVIEGDDYRHPYSIAWNAQVDHEFATNFLLRLGYEERRTRRDFVVEPQLRGANDSLLLLTNDGESRYREFQVTARYRVQERRNLFLAYTRARATGDLNDFNTYFGNARDPVLRPNERSRQPFDAPNRLLFWGDIGLPFDVVVTPVVDWRSGFPFSLLDENQNYIGGRNRAGRFPSYFTLDLQATKGLTIRVPSLGIIPATFRGRAVKGRAGIKLFNLTNHWNPRDVQENIASPDFGTFYNSVRRTLRLKFEFVKF